MANMLIRKVDIVNINQDKTFEIDIEKIEVNNDPYLKRIEAIKGYITFFYDISDKLCIEYELKGAMVCPDCYTLKDVYLDFNLENEDDVTFDEDQEGFFIYGDIKLEDLIISIVLPEVPIKVENSNKIGYHSEDGWSIMSEEEYDLAQKNRLDPRLQVLKDYKEEK